MARDLVFPLTEYEIAGNHHPHRKSRADRKGRLNGEGAADDLLSDLVEALRHSLLGINNKVRNRNPWQRLDDGARMRRTNLNAFAVFTGTSREAGSPEPRTVGC